MNVAPAPSLTTVTLVMAALGGVPVTFDIHAEFFAILASDGDIDVQIDGGAVARLAKGFRYRAPRGQAFKKLSIINQYGAQNTVKLAYGVGDFEDARLTLTNTPPMVGGNGFSTGADIALNNGAQTVLAGAQANVMEHIIVSLATNTVEVRIGDGGVAANNGIPLQPGQSVTLRTTAAVRAFTGAAGQSVSYSVITVPV